MNQRISVSNSRNQLLMDFAKSLGLILRPQHFNQELPFVYKNEMLFQEATDSLFPAIHELAHALRVPCGQNLVVYLDSASPREHLWVYAMETTIENFLNLDRTSSTLNELAMEFSEQEFKREILAILPEGTRNPFENLYSENPQKEWFDLLEPFLKETQKQLNIFLESLAFNSEGWVILR